MTRVAIIAPALALRAGLDALLSHETDIEVVVEATSIEAVDCLPAPIDVWIFVVEPINLPDLDLLQAHGNAAVLFLVTGEAAAYRLIRAGLVRQLSSNTWGVLSLDVSADELLAAIHALEMGLVVIAPFLAEGVLSDALSTEMDGVRSLPDHLTGREVEVLQYLSQGLTNKQIAVMLDISEHTVKFHISSIYAKLGVMNRAEAVRVGIQHGLLVI
jgi:DNA-binding NarL/FixJ family response regulator